MLMLRTWTAREWWFDFCSPPRQRFHDRDGRWNRMCSMLVQLSVAEFFSSFALVYDIEHRSLTCERRYYDHIRMASTISLVSCCTDEWWIQRCGGVREKNFTGGWLCESEISPFETLGPTRSALVTTIFWSSAWFWRKRVGVRRLGAVG
jgi:hypothetical protein